MRLCSHPSLTKSQAGTSSSPTPARAPFRRRRQRQATASARREKRDDERNAPEAGQGCELNHRPHIGLRVGETAESAEGRDQRYQVLLGGKESWECKDRDNRMASSFHGAPRKRHEHNREGDEQHPEQEHGWGHCTVRQDQIQGANRRSAKSRDRSAAGAQVGDQDEQLQRRDPGQRPDMVYPGRVEPHRAAQKHSNPCAHRLPFFDAGSLQATIIVSNKPGTRTDDHEMIRRGFQRFPGEKVKEVPFPAACLRARRCNVPTEPPAK